MVTIRNAQTGSDITQTGSDITQAEQTDTPRRTAGQERVKQASTAVTIRLFGTRDYEAVVAVHNAVFPDRPGTVEEWRYDDEHLDARCANERYVAEEQTGEVLGFAGLWQNPWAFSPRTFEAEIRVHPGARRRGIGRRLWERLAAALRARDALRVKTQVWEAMPAGAAFAARLGFREVLRAWESRLDVAGFAAAAFQPALARSRAAGVEFTTLAAQRAHHPERLRELRAAEMEIAEDVPRPAGEPYTPLPFEQWMERVVEAPWALPDAYFIALVDGEYAGISGLFRPQVGDWLNQGLTGVRRRYRGRGIATALKVLTVAYARDHGVREIRTWNETHNQRMLAINTKLGFVRQPAWITLQKDLQG